MVSFLIFSLSARMARAASEVDISGREIAEALVIAVVVVMLDKGRDGRLEFALQIVVFQQNAVLEGLVPALDLALCLGMIGGAADMGHTMFFEVFGKVTGDVTWAVVAQQPGLVQHGDAVTSRGGKGDIKCRADIVRVHGGAQLPANNVAGKVIQHGGQVEPSPACHLEIGEVARTTSGLAERSCP